MREKFSTIAELIADARNSVIYPRRSRRHHTCATCGQMYDKTDPAQATHHLSAAHPKWAP